MLRITFASQHWDPEHDRTKAARRNVGNDQHLEEGQRKRHREVTSGKRRLAAFEAVNLT